jgi:hypothetical protein
VATQALEKINDDRESLRLLQALAKRRARVLVKHYWPEIEALAKELTARTTLSGDEAQEVVEKSLRERGGGKMVF